MEIVSCFSVLFLVLVSTCNVRGTCNLSLQDDFPKPSPVFIQNGGFLAPNATGAISLRKSQTLLIACTGPRRRVILGNVTTSFDVLEAKCLSNNSFKIDSLQWKGPIKAIKCNTQPYFTSEEVKGCGRGRKMYRIGYKIKEDFYSLYEACFDPLLVRTLYVRHEMTPSSIFFYKDKQRPQFTEGGLFGKVKMSKLYSLSNQKARIDDLLGTNASAQYINKNMKLSRGHLAARADFSLRAAQVATFHYVNTAPQWQRGNAGDWAALEEALKRRINTLGRAVTVYTGTHGVLTFDGNKELYLTTDENNNGIVPVPLYFYKLVHDPKTRKAVVFVSINSSFYNSTITDQLTICEDVCDRKEYSWLTWRADGTTSFCCSYDDAEELELPKLAVDGLFH